MLLAVLFVLVGIVLLSYGADYFVEGAAAIAVKLNISAVVVGAIIIGFGTSAPEMLVSGLAASDGDLDLGVGNVVGSNVANLSLVLGVAGLVAAIGVGHSTLRRELPLSVASVGLFAFLVQDGLARWEGALLAAALVVAIGFIICTNRSTGAALPEDIEIDESASLGFSSAITAGGLIATVGGAWLLVEGAQTIADEAGLSGGFVGLTLVAIGTSLPELMTAVAASRKGETDLIIGNLLGSNMFNSLAVGGLIGLIGPGPLLDGNLAGIATIIMLGVALSAALFMVTDQRVVRWEAAFLLVAYLVTMPFTISEEVDCEETPTDIACTTSPASG